MRPGGRPTEVRACSRAGPILRSTIQLAGGEEGAAGPARHVAEPFAAGDHHGRVFDAHEDGGLDVGGQEGHVPAFGQDAGAEGQAPRRS